MVNMQSYLLQLLAIAAVLPAVYSMPLEVAEGQVGEVRPLFNRSFFLPWLPASTDGRLTGDTPIVARV